MSKRFYFIPILSLFLGGILPQSSFAIEGGASAQNSAFVVPIVSTYSANYVTTCSGALLSSRIVATAGHCVLDENGLLSSKIRIGTPGGSSTFDQSWDTADSVQITNSFQNGLDNKVGSDDIVFVVLKNGLKVITPVRIASEDEMQEMKSAKAKLKLFGYGYITDSGQVSNLPNSLEASFSTSTSATLKNTAYAISSTANVCSGDSGGPVLKVSPNEVIVVGVITGSSSTVTGKCSKKHTDGNYWTLFSLLNRYSNLAFSSAITASDNLVKVLEANKSANEQMISALDSDYKTKLKAAEIKTSLDSKTISDLNASLAGKTTELSILESKSSADAESSAKLLAEKDLEIANLKTGSQELQKQLEISASTLAETLRQLEASQVLINTLKAKLPRSITCQKGTSTKKVTGVNPKCPTGYKLK
jgi:hypothetical protein